MTGNIGVKEIERLIQKLEIDKEILADQEDEAAVEGPTKPKYPRDVKEAAN